jgi:hypothetical protein
VQDSVQDEDSSSSALIHAADEEDRECFSDTEARLQIATDRSTWSGASMPSSSSSSMLCCFTSTGRFQPLGSPKFGSMLWQSTGGFKFLSRTLSGALLPPQPVELQGRLTVVLDLDGAQVHCFQLPLYDPIADAYCFSDRFDDI